MVQISPIQKQKGEELFAIFDHWNHKMAESLSRLIWLPGANEGFSPYFCPSSTLWTSKDQNPEFPFLLYLFLFIFFFG